MGNHSHGKYGTVFPEVNDMDQVKIGKFIATLRKEAELTQESLGEKIGVTNKTISRWENGNYMPDIEMFQILAETFDVGINELLAGQRLTDEEYRKKADENIIAVSKESAFSLAERKAYWKRKWRKEHAALLIALCLIVLASAIIPFIIHRPYLAGLAPVIGVITYAWQNNRMMAYVEEHLYGDHA